MTVTMGLIADPGLPSELTRDLAGELPEALKSNLGEGDWEVSFRCEALSLDDHGHIPLGEIAERERRRDHWDLVVCVTDLPRCAGGSAVVADISTTHRAALASLPALAGLSVRRRLLDAVVRLAAELRQEASPSPRMRRRGLIAPVKMTGNAGKDVDASLVLVGPRGWARLLFGMVRDNRPWRMVPSLSRALAASAASAAFGVFYSSIWAMADFLSAGRLALITFFAIAAMVVWLIAYNDLWERATGRTPRAQAVLYNAATVGTVFLGVACIYAVLLVVTTLAALAVISAPYLAKSLGHTADFGNYLKLAWLSASLGTVAGALGSSFESEEAVQQATYSRRERERRARTREAEQREQEEAARDRDG
ncbi:hypothetical protein [Amycolatopsis pigmentata]|uniref:5,10-methylene-tetrahydrofolate dehydrogenase n=1 Tax=Amycolatopsis pigmentata TaxID=450801 RepID=A0ABW5FP43_9PSEU